MESLFTYTSDDDNDDCERKKTDDECGVKGELDANYDSVTMEMSEDSSPEHGPGQTDCAEKGGSKLDGLISARRTSMSTTEESSSDESDTRDRTKYYNSEHAKSRSPSRRKSEDQDKHGSSYDANHSKSRTNSESDNHHSDKKRERDKERDRRRHRSHSHSRDRWSHSSRRSRSPSHRHRDRSSSRHRSRGYSSRKDRGRDRDGKRSRSRSRERSQGHSSRGDKKLTILERLGIELKVPDGVMTPQMALQKSVEEQVARVKDATGIALPSYYNPMAVNPSKYAEQMQKRKLLWSGVQKKQANNASEKKEEGGNINTAGNGTANRSFNVWQGATFSQDQDGKLTAKFKRLMGIKNQEGDSMTSNSSSSSTSGGSELIKKQEEMFNSMEMQYEVARVATHTHRGLGLGFGVHQYPR